MRMGRIILATTVAAVLAFWAAASAIAFETQTNADGGVTVKVTPKNISAGSKNWEFEVSLGTHMGDLGQDLAKVSVLIDAEGKEHAAIGWDGDPPGGHHRKGVLRFQPLDAVPPTLELRISGVAGVTRVFRWKLS
jgi:hypothetical protein